MAPSEYETEYEVNANRSCLTSLCTAKIRYFKVTVKFQINLNHFVFSSSATVYGSATAPLIETSPVGIGITNPYGQTKYMAETILLDVCNAHPQLQCSCLRYFNPVGAHPSGLLGENTKSIPTNLMPYIIRVAAKHNNIVDLGDAYHELSIFGGDYQTQDGTCIRDFIHVCDTY